MNRYKSLSGISEGHPPTTHQHLDIMIIEQREQFLASVVEEQGLNTV